MSVEFYYCSRCKTEHISNAIVF